jgi:phosphoribosylformylglycinamidine synthase
MKIKVIVRLKQGVLDPQGKAVENTSKKLGFEGFENFRIGKIIEFTTSIDNKEEIMEKAQALAKKLLANTVIENFEVELAEE